MLNPYILVAALLGAIGLFGSGVSVGYKWESGVHAKEAVKLANAAADKSRADAKTEFDAAHRAVSEAASTRQAMVIKKHTLELEIARDEAARTCRVSDGTFSVLLTTINQANGVAPQAGSVNVGVPLVSDPTKSTGVGFGARLGGWFGGLHGVSPVKIGADRVDQPQ